MTLCLQIIAAGFANRRAPKPTSCYYGTVAVIVPAHDEVQTIGATCRSIRVELRQQDRLVVVADNCSDDTARVAREEGAEVIERIDPLRRGKGYALDHARAHLNRSPPDIVLVVDADCGMSTAGIGLLAARCHETNRPIQAAYRMRNHEGAPIPMKVAEFASLIKCVVRPLGNSVLGLPNHLMGTGMAIPWRLFATHQQATGHIVEDLKLGLELAKSGHYPLFCPEVQVSSYFPETSEGARSQRTRWEHGHLGVIVSDGPGIVVKAIKNWQPSLLAMGLDLLVPPLALLATWLAFVSLVTTSIAMLTGSYGALWAALCVDGMFFAVMAWAWWHYGRPILAFWDFVHIPLYAAAKLPVYLRFFYKPQSEWVRTERRRDNR